MTDGNNKHGTHDGSKSSNNSDTLTNGQICAILYCLTVWFVIIPVICYYMIQYCKVYKTGKLNVVRKKHIIQIITMETFIILFISIDRPMVILLYFFHSKQWIDNPITRNCQELFLGLFLYGIFTTLVWRTWTLYYATKLNQWRQNSKWKKVLNPERNDEDWYRSHRKTFGNAYIVARYLIILWITIAGIHYALYLCIEFDDYFHAIAGAFYAVFIACIYFKIPRNRDIFHLKDEVRLILYMSVAIMALYVVDLFVPTTRYYWIYFLCKECLYLLFAFLISLMSTAYVLRQLEKKASRNGSVMKLGIHMDSQNTKRKMSKIRNKKNRSSANKNVRTLAHINEDHSDAPEDNESSISGGNSNNNKNSGAAAGLASILDDLGSNKTKTAKKPRTSMLDFGAEMVDMADNFIYITGLGLPRQVSFVVGDKFNFVLNDESLFELFMSHVKKEYSMENMLAFIEFCQFEDLCIENDERMSFFKKYNFIFYNGVPKSHIVHNSEDDMSTKYLKLLDKYVLFGAEWELNLSYECRQNAIKLSHDICKEPDTVDNERVLDSVEHILTAIRSLIFDTFSRFDGTFDINVSEMEYEKAFTLRESQNRAHSTLKSLN